MKKEILSINLSQAVAEGILPEGKLTPPKAYSFDTLSILEDGTVLCGGKNVAKLNKDQLAQAAAVAKASGGPADVPEVTGEGEDASLDIPDDGTDHGEPPLL